MTDGEGRSRPAPRWTPALDAFAAAVAADADRLDRPAPLVAGSTRPRFSEVTPGDPTVPPGNRRFHSPAQRRIGRLAGYGAGWLAVTALDRLVAAVDRAEGPPC